MSESKTVQVRHTGDGGPVRVKLSEITEERGAATIAAGILARRMFGRRGTVVTLRLDSHAANGSSATWEASIGTPADGGGYAVKSVWLYT